MNNMFDFPSDRYKYYVAKTVDGKPYKVVAVSTYCGHNVRGVAKCSNEDEFDLEKGMKLAAARCNEKIAEKRVARACYKYKDAIDLHNEAIRYHDKMNAYYADAIQAREKAKNTVKELLKEY